MTEVTVCASPNRLKGEISFEERERQLKVLEKQEERERKKMHDSPYIEFAQLNMHKKICEDTMYKLSNSPAASKLFWFIANHMDGYNALIASYKVFEEALGLSKPTITRGIKFLKDMGLLVIKKSGSANVYIINPQLIWKSWGNNLKYCEFPANVILSQSEQDEQEKTRAEMTERFKKVLETKN